MNSVQDINSNKIERLPIYDLREGMPGITQAFGECLAQAASVCLEDQKHESNTKLSVDGDFKKIYALLWEEATEQIRRCWGDEEVTTEHGAYGIAILLIPRLTEMTVIERSRKGTGFDYWLGSKSNFEPLFQEKARLEVSGIRNGTEAQIRSRVNKKLEQTNKSDGSLPAIVAVVEFSEPRSHIIKK